MRFKMFILMTVVLLMMPAAASAALIDDTFTNLYDGVDRIELSLTQTDFFANNTIDSVLFEGSASTGWSILSGAGSDSVVLSGSALTVGSGVFTLTFNDQAGPFWSGLGGVNWLFDFDLLWTEYSGMTVLGQTTYEFENGVIATPIPASAWMLMSGLAIFLGIRRHRVG